MNKIQTLGILSVLFLAGAGIASAFHMGEGMDRGAGQMTGPGIGALKQMDATDREALHEALLAGDWGAFSTIMEKYPFGNSITEEQFLEMSEKVGERDAIHEAVLAGDWETYSSLVEGYNITSGIHAKMTEDAFPTFSELANLRHQQMELRQQLAEELGLEPPKGLGLGKHRGFWRMRGMGRGSGPGVGNGAGV